MGGTWPLVLVVTKCTSEPTEISSILRLQFLLKNN